MVRLRMTLFSKSANIVLTKTKKISPFSMMAREFIRQAMPNMTTCHMGTLG